MKILGSSTTTGALRTDPIYKCATHGRSRPYWEGRYDYDLAVFVVQTGCILVRSQRVRSNVQNIHDCVPHSGLLLER